MPLNVRPRKPRTILPEAAEQAMENRNRLYRAYRKTVLANREELFRSSQEGMDLRSFATAVKQSGSGVDAIVTLLRQSPWLRNAPEPIRLEALRIINEYVMRQRIKQNKPPLDDPLPGQPDDIYRICKRELGL
jgi:hypothetical protein